MKKRDEVYADLPWIRLMREVVLLPSGQTIDNFYRVSMPAHSVAVPFTRDGLLVVERQYKHGVGSSVIGFPAGFIERGETPLGAAKRELLEETGYRAPSWKSLGDFVLDGNHGAGCVHVFGAHNAVQVAAPRVDPKEQVHVTTMRPERFQEALSGGKVAVASHALAFMLASGDATTRSRNRGVRA